MAKKHLSNQLFDLFNLAYIEKDLVLITFWMVASFCCIYFPFFNQSFLRILFALPMVLFIPGYVLIAAFFPATEDLDGIERLALSFGLSIALVPLIGLVLNYTPWGIRIAPIIVSLVIFTAVMVLITYYRRSLLDPDKRFMIPFHKMFIEIKDGLFKPFQSQREKTFSIILIIAIATVIACLIFVIVVPQKGENFTEFYILGQSGKAVDYPERFQVSEEQSLIIGIRNYEHRDVTYTLEIILQNQIVDPTTNTSVISLYQPLDSFAVTLPHNDSQEFPYNFTVNNLKYNRIQFLLFNETVPSSEITGQDRINASYRDLHLWITVSPEMAS